MLLEYWCPVLLNFDQILKKSGKSLLFRHWLICWLNDTEKKVEKGKCVMQIIFIPWNSRNQSHFSHYFSVSIDSLKMTYLKAVRYVKNFWTLRHMISSLWLKDFSYQSSLAVWNVNLNYQCNRQTRLLNPSLFHYIINMKNDLVSRNSLISSMYVRHT